jgi:hypothetical protein
VLAPNAMPCICMVSNTPLYSALTLLQSQGGHALVSIFLPVLMEAARKPRGPDHPHFRPAVIERNQPGRP